MNLTNESITVDISKTNPKPIEQGFKSVQGEISVLHPVQQIQEQYHKNASKIKRDNLHVIYGAHMPMRLQMEREILSQFHRLPGLPSQHLGLETLAMRDEFLDVEDTLGADIGLGMGGIDLPGGFLDFQLEDIHAQMEKKLGIAEKGTLKH